MLIVSLKVSALASYTKTISLNLCSSSLRQVRDFRFLSFLNKKNRSCFEIIATMLEALKDNGLLQFSLMKHTNISYAQFKKYLKALSEIGLIQTAINGDRVVYIASEKGLAFLNQYYVLRDMLLTPYPKSAPINVANEGMHKIPNGQQPRVTHVAAYAPLIQKQKH